MIVLFIVEMESMIHELRLQNQNMRKENLKLRDTMRVRAQYLGAFPDASIFRSRHTRNTRSVKKRRKKQRPQSLNMRKHSKRSQKQPVSMIKSSNNFVEHDRCDTSDYVHSEEEKNNGNDLIATNSDVASSRYVTNDQIATMLKEIKNQMNENNNQSNIIQNEPAKQTQKALELNKGEEFALHEIRKELRDKRSQISMLTVQYERLQSNLKADRIIQQQALEQCEKFKQMLKQSELKNQELQTQISVCICHVFAINLIIYNIKFLKNIHQHNFISEFAN